MGFKCTRGFNKHRFLMNFNYFCKRNKTTLKSPNKYEITEECIRERLMCKDGREHMLKRVNRLKKRGVIPKTTTGGLSKKGASVLVPLCIVDGKLSLLYTLRSPFLSTHAGQVSFPGGIHSKLDESVEDTALRETEEEIGLSRSNVEVWMSLPRVPDRQGKYSITPIVGYLSELILSDLKVNEAEVHDVFVLSLQHLLNTENQSFTQFKNGWTMPVYLNGKHKIWGITSCLTELLLVNAFPEYYQPKFSRYHGNLQKRHLCI